MANEISNRMHAAVKVAANGTIIARSAAILSVVRSALGTYVVTLVDEISEGFCTYDVAFDTNAIPPGTGGYVCPRQDTSVPGVRNKFNVLTFDGLGAAADAQFCLTIYRLPNRL